MGRRVMRRRVQALRRAAPLIILCLLVLVLLGVAGWSLLRPGDGGEQRKTLIIFAEAMPHDFVMDNLDELPNIKALCDEGFCASMRPAAPTFTSMQNHVIATGKYPDNAEFAYNFILNETSLQAGTCSFWGEISVLSRKGQPDLYQEISRHRRSTFYSTMRGEERYAAEIFPRLPGLLAKHDVVRTYVTDTDSHFVDLTVKGPGSPMLARLKEFDGQLGALIAQLKAQGLYERTDIILYGDHGMAAIRKHEYLPEILQELNRSVPVDRLCYWNDAGTALRFWVLPPASGAPDDKAAIVQGLTSFFAARDECFMVVDDALLEREHLLFKDEHVKWMSFGDVAISVHPWCKVATRMAGGGMERGFAEHQDKVDKYRSMHGYLDSTYPELQGLVVIRTPGRVPAEGLERNFTVMTLHDAIRDVVYREGVLFREG